MIEVTFIFRNCGRKFEARIFEKGEAEEKRIPGSPVRCPNCNSPTVKRN